MYEMASHFFLCESIGVESGIYRECLATEALSGNDYRHDTLHSYFAAVGLCLGENNNYFAIVTCSSVEILGGPNNTLL